MKKQFTYLAAALMALTVAFTGCGKKQQDVKKGKDVYVLGSVSADIVYPVLWKNGVEQPISDDGYFGYYHDEGGIGGSVNSVFVSGSDVYVVGWEYAPQESGQVATLWKNGKFQSLGKGKANSVFVSGEDVYIAGYDYKSDTHEQFATLWKNGVAQRLSSRISSANSVFVSGNDVYVVGEEIEINAQWEQMAFAMLWKNGKPQRLSSRGKSDAKSVFVLGNDVYVAGCEYQHKDSYSPGELTYSNSVAILWKNGRPTRLRSLGESVANSVFVSGDDVYVAGQDMRDECATLWKNGIPQYFYNDNSAAASVFVSDNDVYVAGNLDRVGTLWKNGEPQRLLGDYSINNLVSVFVATPQPSSH